MEQLIVEFENFARNNARMWSDLYVGIARDPVDRLTNGHGVNHSVPHLYWNQPFNSADVRQLEKYFLAKGARGGSGGGDGETSYIYIYKISPSTRE